MWRTDAVIVLAIFILSLLAFSYLPSNGFISSDCSLKYIQMESFFHSRWRSLDIPYRAKDIDGPMKWISHHILLLISKDKVYVAFPPLFPFLSSIPFSLLGGRVIYLIPLLSFFISLIVLMKLLRLFLKDTRLYYGILFLYGCASPLLIYSISFAEHMPAIASVMLSSYFVTAFFLKRELPVYLFLGSLFLGVAVFFRTEIFFLIVAYHMCFGAYFIKAGRASSAGMMTLGMLIPLVLYFVSNYVFYGTPLGFHIVHYRNIYRPDYMSLLMFFLFLVSVSGYGILYHFAQCDRNAREKLVCFFPILWLGCLMILLPESSVNRFICYFPVCLLLFYPSPLTGEASRHLELYGLITGIFLIFLSGMKFVLVDDPDTSVRFILPIIPFVVVALAIRLNVEKDDKTLKYLAGLLVVFSLLINLWNVRFDVEHLYFSHNRIAFVNEHTQQDDVIILSDYGLFEELGPLYFKRKFMVAENQDEVKSLFQDLRRKNINTAFFMTSRDDELLPFLMDNCQITDKRIFSQYLVLCRIDVP